jgi:hypothetical protein
VRQLSARLGQQMQCPPADLVLICKGMILTNHLNSTLASLGLFKPVGFKFTPVKRCKILISRRPPGPTWIHLTTTFLCTTSLKPIFCRMHTASPIANVKRQLRELLRCPGACLSLYAGDGELLSETTSLRDLGDIDGGRLYCRILAEEPAVPPAPNSSAGASAAAAAAVRELIRAADFAWHGDSIKVGAGSGRRKRQPECEEQEGAAAKAVCRAFSGMRRGFLSGR